VINPHVSHHAKADAQGAFETFVGPGDFRAIVYLRTARIDQCFKVAAGQPEIELDLRAADASTEPKTFKGRVVRRDRPDAGVAEATIQGESLGDDTFRIEGTSGADGSFTAYRPSSDVYLHASTADRKTQGILVAKAGDLAAGVTIPAGPTASAAGRLVDEGGKPMAGRGLQYGVRVTHVRGSYGDRFGGKTRTADDGSFVLDGLVPGFDYQINLTTVADEDGSPRQSHTVGRARADRPERVGLGDLRYAESERP
jgi:hypothetical protein